jgi:hypothetical protein
MLDFSSELFIRRRMAWYIMKTVPSYSGGRPLPMCEFFSVAIINDCPGLAPTELIAMQQGVDRDNDVQDWRSKEIDEEADDEPDAIDAGGREPGHDQEGVT